MRGKRLLRAISAQAHIELLLTLRRGESILATLVIPAALLVFFASTRVFPSGSRTIDFLLPGTLVLAVASTGLVSLGIATAYERHYGVLKRYGSTPFSRGSLITSKLLAATVLELVQIILLVLIATAIFGWRPHGSPLAAGVVLVLGTVTFASMGLSMAGALRAEATLAGANGLFVLFMLVGGLFVPVSHLPGWLAPVARLLPPDALADVLRSVLRRNPSLPLESALVVVTWALAMPVVAARTFHWE